MSLDLRVLSADDLPAAADLMALAFGSSLSEEDRAGEQMVLEPERMLGSFDGDRMVGAVAAFSFDLSVPYGSVPCAGTTWVGVAPTHRRRGVLRGMMTRHLDDIAAGEEPIAALWASEVPIYGRFGYGAACDTLTIRTDVRGGPDWRTTSPPPPDRVRLVPLEDAQAVIAPLYEAARRRRGGMHARDDRWWAFNALSTRSDAMEHIAVKYVAVAERDGEDVAYAIYGMKESWTTQGRPEGTLTVKEMTGVDGRAEAAMWRYLCEHDLIATVQAFRRPLDDPLPLLLHDPRRVERKMMDALHVRIIDLPTALTARGYSADARVRVAVRDARFSANNGCWELELSPEGASVTRSHASPDLSLEVMDLGALYLGAVEPHSLAAAGRIEVHDPAALAALGPALQAPEAPMPPEIW